MKLYFILLKKFQTRSLVAPLNGQLKKNLAYQYSQPQNDTNSELLSEEEGEKTSNEQNQSSSIRNCTKSNNNSSEAPFSFFYLIFPIAKHLNQFNTSNRTNTLELNSEMVQLKKGIKLRFELFF